MMSPSRILPSVNFQPSSTHRTMPSSRTRLVEAIKKESAFTGWAPLTSTEREAASAANEQEDETNPKKLASPAFVGPRSPSTFTICSLVTSTWIPAEIKSPKWIEQVKKGRSYTGVAPLTRTDREGASAANGHEVETNPNKLASPVFGGPRSPSTFAICSRVTRTWMPAEIM